MRNELPDAAEGVTYDPETGIYRTTFDNTRSTPSIAVVNALANILGCDPTGLEPLYKHIDAEALDQFLVMPKNSSASDRKVEFTFQNYSVSILSCGLIKVRGIPANESIEDE